MFQTDESWEQTSNLQVLRSIMGKPGLRQYPLVDLSTNVYLFHVDVLFKGEGVELDLWERFICYDLATTVELIEQDEVADVRVSLQTKFSRDSSYLIYKVSEIKCVSTMENAHAYACMCENGFYFEDYPNFEAGKMVDNLRIILPRV